MNTTQQSQEKPLPSEKVRAEAAAWIARLHDERRSPDLDAKVRAWLGEREDHQRAFDRMTHVWRRAGQIRMRARGDAGASRAKRSPRFASWAAAAAAALVLAVGAAAYYWHDNDIATAIGQQRVRLLRDGTRVVLNTDTRLEVSYDDRARRVRLIRGEAWFDVSKNPNWPFLVTVGGEEIRALGTSFIVRHDGIEDLSIILVEGRVSVAPIARPDEAVSQNPQILSPGQRLIMSRNRAPAVDRPELAHITAWKRGRVELEETPLRDAANEMNRYSKRHIIVADADISQLRIGGVFRAGDSDEFIRIVTATFGLRADRQGADIVLSRPKAAAL